MSLWNRYSIDQDPNIGTSQPDEGEGLLHADSVKCPSCASNIFFEPSLNAMMCRNCGGVFATDTLEPRGSLGIDKELDYSSDEDVSDSDKKRHEIVCNSCGAVLVADENTMSTMCPFCGSPALITQRMSREFKPDYIVPFKIDKERAQSIMKDWIASRNYTPRGFRTKSRLARMTALYVPFWLLDCCVNSELSGSGNSGRFLSEINAKIKYYVKGVPFDASLSIANKLMEAVEPYDYSEMVKFENKHLQGFYADKYDQVPTQMTDRIMRRMEKYSLYANKFISGKYPSYEASHEKDFTYLNEISIKYCLLPVWFMTVEFGGRQYQFAVNGQTGEACGQVPTSDEADLYDRLIFKLNDGRITFFNLLAIVVLAVALGFLTLNFSAGVNIIKTIAVVLLCICEILAIILFFAVILIRMLHNNFSPRNGKSASEINDYDKEPDLEIYFDATRKTDIDIKEFPLSGARGVNEDRGEPGESRVL